MPKQTRSQAPTRTGAAEDLARPGARQTARTPYVQYPHVRADRTAGANELLVAKAAAGLGGEMVKIGMRQQAEELERTRMRAKADAIKAGAPEGWNNHLVTMQEEYGEEYTKAYEKVSATIAGQRAGQELLTMSSEMGTEAELDEAVKTAFEGLSQGLDGSSPEAQAAALESLRAAELKARPTVAKREMDANYEVVLSSHAQSIQYDLNTLPVNASAADVKNLMAEARARSVVAGVAPEDHNKALVTAVGELAVAEGAPELMNMFDFPAADGTPGLAMTETMGPTIRSYASKAQDAAVKKQKAVAEANLYENLGQIDAMSRDGNYEEAIRQLDLLEETGMLTGSKAHSERTKILDDMEENRATGKIHNDIMDGATLTYSKEDLQKGLDSITDDAMDTARKAGTPQAMVEALEHVMRASAQTSLLPKAHKNAMTNINPSNPEQMASALELARSYEVRAPAAYNTLPAEVRMEHKTMRRMQQQGESQENIAAWIMQMRDPEWQANRKALRQTDNYKELRAALDKEFEEVGGFFMGIGSGNLTNVQNVKRRITETALDYHQRTGRPMDESFEYAQETFERNHVMVKKGDGSGFMAVYRGVGSAQPDNLGEILTHFSELESAKLSALPTYEEGDYVTIVPDPSIPGMYQVLDQNGVPQLDMATGTARIRRIPESQLMQLWEDKTNLETQERVDRKAAERARQMSRRQRGRNRTRRERAQQEALPDDFMPPYEDPTPPEDFMPEFGDEPAEVPAPPGPYEAPTPEVDRKVQLIREIAEGEGTTDKQAIRAGFKSGYDVPYAYGKYGKPGKPLTEMTIAEVKAYQAKQIGRTKGKIPGTDKGTGAVGKYQVTQGTLKMAQKALGFKDSDRYDEKLQDAIGAYLLDKRGYTKYINGEITKEQFQDNLSKEWASIADPATGKSRYGQATGTTLDELESVLN